MITSVEQFISPPKGRYVVAVSGGVDSMVLLDAMRLLPGIEIIAAHLQHGIRSDADKDQQLVADYCKTHDITFVTESVQLGSGASEAMARKARRDFLLKTKQKTSALAIATAHHKDDVVETAVINLLRGTGRRGLSSLKDSDEFIRPLIKSTKASLYDYAKANDIPWREDSTNTDQSYLRNYIRHSVLPEADAAAKTDLYKHTQDSLEINAAIEPLLKQVYSSIVSKQGRQIKRQDFTVLPHAIATEISREVLTALPAENIVTAKRIEQLTHFIKTAKPGRKLDISKALMADATKTLVKISTK